MPDDMTAAEAIAEHSAWLDYPPNVPGQPLDAWAMYLPTVRAWVQVDDNGRPQLVISDGFCTTVLAVGPTGGPRIRQLSAAALEQVAAAAQDAAVQLRQVGESS